MLVNALGNVDKIAVDVAERRACVKVTPESAVRACQTVDFRVVRDVLNAGLVRELKNR